MTAKRIIVTRPEAQAGPWIAKITAAGLSYAYIPVLDIVPVDSSGQQKVKNIIQQLDEQAYLIFVSQNAVKYGFDWIEDYWPQFPQALPCLAIGTKTQQAVQDRLEHFAQAGNVAGASSLMNSEELLALPCLQNVRDKKITIFRGVGGRTTLYDTLSARGAIVQHCELYERKLPSSSLDEMRTQAVNPGRDILTIFSGESLANFHQLLQEVGVNNWQNLITIVPSERVKNSALAQGFQNVHTALNATEEAMWQAMLPHLSTK